MRDAEEYAEEDRKRREEAETRNQAEALVYQTEKFLAENGDKLPAEGKAEVEEALAELQVGARRQRHRGRSRRRRRSSPRRARSSAPRCTRSQAAAAPPVLRAPAGLPAADDVVDAEIVTTRASDGSRP